MRLRSSGTTLLAVFVILLFGSFSALAPEPDFGGSVINYFQTIGKTPQEKLYLHLDKPYYGAGEEIWFRGYLLNAITHMDNSPSNYIYVELTARGDSVLQRFKFRRDSLGFRGSIPLPADLPPGEYYLRGYTSWMQNTDPAFFYRHSLQIGNSIVTDILSEVTERPAPDNGGTLRIRFFNAAGGVHSGIKVSYDVSGKDLKTVTGQQTTDDKGVMTVQNLKLSPGNMRIAVKFEDETLDYSNTFNINNASEDEYAVSFFPEGGSLMNGVTQHVAFKAQAATGLSLPVTGFVTNARGDTLTSFATEHDGMGTLMLTPEAGQRYTAETRSEKGIVKRFPLPEARSDGLGLQMAFRNGAIFYNVQKAAETVWPDSLFLIAHLRGDIRMMLPLSPEKISGKLSGDAFPDGIVHFLLADENGTPISERLLFVRHPDAVEWNVATDKPKYGKREPVRMEISLADLGGQPAEGEFSMSITDNHTVYPDSLGDNILSNILLTSDLKGYIENPGYYFNSPYTPAVQRHLDLVMLTHGWRRFRIENLTRTPQFEAKYFIEAGQAVSGQVKNAFGKGASDASIVAYSPDCFMMKRADENGRFLIDSIQFSDTVSLVLQATTRKGGSGVDILVDPETFPKADSMPFPYGKDSLAGFGKYLANVRDKYYNSGGMRVIQLKEVIVEAKQKQRNFYATMAEQTITSDKVPEFMRSRLVTDFLSTVPGIRKLSETKLSIRGSDITPLILIDEVPYYDNDVLSRIYMNEVSSISIIKGGSASFFGIKGAGGVISIMRKDGSGPVADLPAPGVAFIKPLGCRVIADFYNPVYETPEQKNASGSDLRTTIYWNPSLRFDETGKASVLFYTSDNPESYRINIEGVTKEGYVTRYSADMGQ